MYQECESCRSTAGARLGRRNPARAHAEACSRLGPEIVVNDAKSLA